MKGGSGKLVVPIVWFDDGVLAVCSMDQSGMESVSDSEMFVPNVFHKAIGSESAANAEAKPAATSTAGCLYVAVDRKSVSRSGVASGTWSWPCDSGVQPAARALRRG